MYQFYSLKIEVCNKIPKGTASKFESCCIWQRDYETGRMEQEISTFVINGFVLSDFSII